MDRLDVAVDVAMGACDEEEETVDTRPKRSLCEVCSETPHRYTCPGCERKTCSLPCIKKHKEESGCNGKRDRLKFVSLQEFDDRVLMSGAGERAFSAHVNVPCIFNAAVILVKLLLHGVHRLSPARGGWEGR